MAIDRNPSRNRTAYMTVPPGAVVYDGTRGLPRFGFVSYNVSYGGGDGFIWYGFGQGGGWFERRGSVVQPATMDPGAIESVTSTGWGPIIGNPGATGSESFVRGLHWAYSDKVWFYFPDEVPADYANQVAANAATNAPVAPVAPVVYAPALPPPQMQLPAIGQSTVPYGRDALLLEVLNQQTDPAMFIANLETSGAGLIASASLGEFNGDSSLYLASMNSYASVSFVRAKEKYNALILTLRDANRPDIINTLQALQAPAAIQALLTTLGDFLAMFCNDDTATTPATTAVGDAWAEVITAWGTYAQAVQGLAATFSTEDNALLLAMALSGGQGGDSMLRGIMLESILLGNASQTFQTTCTSSATDAAAAVTFAATQTAITPFVTGLVTYIRAQAQSRLFSGLGLFKF